MLLPSLHVCAFQDEDMDNVPALRRKLQRVQVSNLNLTRELERAERMLKAQVCTGFYVIFTSLLLLLLFFLWFLFLFLLFSLFFLAFSSLCCF